MNTSTIIITILTITITIITLIIVEWTRMVISYILVYHTKRELDM